MEARLVTVFGVAADGLLKDSFSARMLKTVVGVVTETGTIAYK